MTFDEMQQQIYQSVDIILAERLKDLQFDQCVEVVVQSSAQNTDGSYNVLYQDTTLAAFPLGITLYDKGEVAFMLVINNDLSKKRILLSQRSPIKDQVGDLGTMVSADSITTDSSHRFVTDAQMSTWSGKLSPNTAITGATKTKITYDSKGLVTAGADATTADIIESTNKNYVTDAQKAIINNTSGVNTGDETVSTIKTKLGITTLSGSNTGDETVTSIGTIINGATEKTTPVDADMIPLIDSASSNIIKKLSWANINTILKSYFNSFYAVIGHTHTASNVTDFDSKVSNNTDVSANTSARHTHSNKAVLDATTASFTTADETKLDGIATGANNYSLPIATTTTLGGVKQGTNITIDANGVISGTNSYTLPIASGTVLGGIKVGTNLTINEDGTLNAQAGGSSSSFVIKQEMFVISGGQTSFTLTQGTYTPGTNTMFWYANGVKQSSAALTETSSTVVAIPSGLNDGVRILFEWWQIVANAPNVYSHALQHLTAGDDPIPLATITTSGLMDYNDKVKLNQVTTVTSSTTNGNILLNGTETVVYTHPGTGTNPHGTTASDVGLGNVTNESKATMFASPTFTGTVTLPSTTSIGTVTSTELSYLDGVTSAIQTQLGTKAPLASPTFTGTVSGITATMVGLGTTASVQHGSLGIGTAASGTTGEIRATNNVTAYYSDERLKDFHGTIPDALNKIMTLNGYYFTENQKAKELGYNNDRMQVGVSAQEVQRVLPEVVTSAPVSDEYLTVWYDKLVPVLIEAIKEQQNEIDELKRLVSRIGD